MDSEKFVKNGRLNGWFTLGDEDRDRKLSWVIDKGFFTKEELACIIWMTSDADIEDIMQSLTDAGADNILK